MKKLLTCLFNHLNYRLILAPRGGGKPVPQEFLDGEYRSGAWDHFWKEEEEARHRLLVELIEERGKARSLLDLGCGSGRLASMLNPETIPDYLGVDLSEEGLARARALNLPSKTFLHGNYETWRPSQAYDIITFNECLGYAESPARTLKIFLSFLNPGGCIIVSHYRWGNHEAIWKSLERVSTVTAKREARNDKGQIWDIRVLAPAS